MTTTRLLLVRHGATTLTADDRFAGSTDVPLGVDGRDQADRLRQRLFATPIAAAYSSPLRRAVETAAVVASPHGLPLQLRDDLREVDHGRWEGLRRDEVRRHFPDEYAAWERDPLGFAPNGGETGQHVLDRGRAAVEKIVAAHPDQTVLVVSHKATIRLVVAWLLGLDPRHYRDRLDQQPACLNILDVGPDGARLMLFNDVSHYGCAASALPVAPDHGGGDPTPAPPLVAGPRDLSALRDRVLAEYREMPDLRLTLGQASRLFGIDRSLAAHVLERLSHDHLLARTPDGAYRRPLEA